MANYCNSTHPNGTTAVGAFGTYGYGMCDMAGNVFEWTSNTYYGDCHILRGGSWNTLDYYCAVSRRYLNSAYDMDYFYGFRVCR